MTSDEIRADLVRALRLDLVGPEPDDAELAQEALPQAPARWYLTGFLVPYEAPADQRQDEQGNEQLDLGVAERGDDEDTPEPASARKAFLPSSIGVSVLIPKEAKALTVDVTWGDYRYVEAPATEADGEKEEPSDSRSQWERTPRSQRVEVAVDRATARPTTVEVADSGGLRIVTSVRPVASEAGADAAAQLPAGTRAVSVFVVNHRPPKLEALKDEALVFQAGLALSLDAGFVARPNLRGFLDEDWDERVADLQYRDVWEFAVGHGVATRARVDGDGACRYVATTWVPSAEVERVEPAAIPDVELSMEALSSCQTGEAVRGLTARIVDAYRSWIAQQGQRAPADGPRAEVARILCRDASNVADRIAGGLDALDAPDVLEAFCITNRVMAVSARQRATHGRDLRPEDVEAPRWRPFQLAFLLMNLRGIAEPGHAERELVDLLFFPTGGGKTEAYLGLAAFTLALRRLRDPSVGSAGVTVLMRYTLRLLTLDQLSRAATLICALELERAKNEDRLGRWPFEIGLWVGKAATPNAMGRRGDGKQDTARSRTIAFQNDDRKPCPIPIENCPWCGERFGTRSFRLVPGSDAPTDLRIGCVNRRCAFTRDRALPILAVDEPLYRRLPCFVVATVDKFAALPWLGRVGALFGKVERFDAEGFYGPCDPGRGRALDSALPPPALIIQDELHLISGPLGSMAGLYETAIEALATGEHDGKPVRPKIVASTATVRRADRQIRALFARPRVEIFPPPGPDRRDAFFAVTVPSTQKSARLYVGIAAQGRSPKVMLLRTYLGLLAAAQGHHAASGGRRNKGNPADPYMTLVGYFNSLRELGGSRRIVEDEVTSRLATYGRRRRVGEDAGLFADRKVRYEPVELTSREPTDRVAAAKRRLALPFHEDDCVDVALATNMISVGLDITRLGLMVVLGQPKTTAEYIQATSRVGRDESRPGLVVTLLNAHRPRDRSHYERFEAYHASFYRSVEVTSVTPFAPRAIDRGLAAVTVGLARHARAALTPAAQAVAIEAHRAQLGFVADTIAQRAEAHAILTQDEAEALRQKLRSRVGDLLDEWVRIAKSKRDVGAGLQYQKYEETGPHLLYDPLDPALEKLTSGERKFRAQRSLRDVEASTPLWIKRLDGMDVLEEGDP